MELNMVKCVKLSWEYYTDISKWKHK